MWFEKLTGFREESPQQVRDNITLDVSRLKSRVNGRAFVWGELETPSLAELRERARAGGPEVNVGGDVARVLLEPSSLSVSSIETAHESGSLRFDVCRSRSSNKGSLCSSLAIY